MNMTSKTLEQTYILSQGPTYEIPNFIGHIGSRLKFFKVG